MGYPYQQSTSDTVTSRELPVPLRPIASALSTAYVDIVQQGCIIFSFPGSDLAQSGTRDVNQATPVDAQMFVESVHRSSEQGTVPQRIDEWYQNLPDRYKIITSSAVWQAVRGLEQGLDMKITICDPETQNPLFWIASVRGLYPIQSANSSGDGRTTLEQLKESVTKATSVFIYRYMAGDKTASCKVFDQSTPMVLPELSAQYFMTQGRSDLITCLDEDIRAYSAK